jgi:major type 1 subunit fimbrin (pilin)
MCIPGTTEDAEPLECGGRVAKRRRRRFGSRLCVTSCHGPSESGDGAPSGLTPHSKGSAFSWRFPIPQPVPARRDNPQSAIRNPQSAIRNPQSAIRNPIRNPQSNPQSAIRNPQSAISRG